MLRYFPLCTEREDHWGIFLECGTLSLSILRSKVISLSWNYKYPVPLSRMFLKASHSALYLVGSQWLSNKYVHVLDWMLVVKLGIQNAFAGCCWAIFLYVHSRMSFEAYCKAPAPNIPTLNYVFWIYILCRLLPLLMATMMNVSIYLLYRSFKIYAITLIYVLYYTWLLSSIFLNFWCNPLADAKVKFWFWVLSICWFISLLLLR